MRNEILHGYLIHHRKYRERSHIVHLFTREHGRVDGILRQMPPPNINRFAYKLRENQSLKISLNWKLSINRFFSLVMHFFQAFI